MDSLRQLVLTASSAPDPARRRTAFVALVRRFEAMVYGYAYSRLGDFHIAEDVAQESFLEVFRRLPQLRKPESFPGWLRAIVQTQCGRVKRRVRRETSGLDNAAHVAAPDNDPSALAARAEESLAVRNALMSLGECEREVLILFYIDELSQAEVGDFLSLPVSTINSRLHAARRRLEERMMTMVREYLKDNALKESFATGLLAFPFPRIRPPVRISDLPANDLSVRSRDCQAYFTPLEEAGRCDWCFYDQPDWRLTGVNEHRVVGFLREEGRTVLRVWRRYTQFPEGTCEWNENRILIDEHHWRYVSLKREMPGVAIIGPYRFPGDRENDDATAQPLALRLGTEWDDNTVTGAVEVTIGEQSWRCLKVQGGFQHSKTADGSPAVYAEWYVAESGRTVLFRRYSGEGYVEAGKPRSFEALCGSDEVTFRGKTFRHDYDCIPDVGLETLLA
ncbi:MAG: RNA polymerase sigma factor [Planctomycetota bacterium]